MAIRNTTHVLKKSLVPSQTLPASGILQGEPLINIGDGILFFTGGTSGSPTWVQSDNPTPGYFEVGSNLYQLKIRDKIVSYSGVTNLSGKFLSGSTNGFVLADITDITASVDSYTTGATWTPNTLTINLNNGKPSVPVTIDAFNDISLYGSTDVNGDLTVTGITNLNGLSYYNNTVTGTDPNEIVNYGSLTAFSQSNDVYVTGNTLTPAGNNTNTQILDLTYHGTPIGGPYFLGAEDTFTTGGTYDNNTALITFDKNDGSNYSVSLSGIDVNDTYVTGFTYNPTNNTFTIKQNQGQPDLTASFDEVSGLTVTNDLVVMGDLSVFGTAISAFTSQLYVEDPSVIFNYNPTGSTTLTSVNSGMVIQDGNGLSGGSVNLDIVRMQNLTGLTSTEVPDVSEYSGSTGYENRGWITQLNDIVIRSTDVTDGGSPGDFNGVRVLGEFDILDSGFY